MSAEFTGFEPPDDWVGTLQARSTTPDNNAKPTEAAHEIEGKDQEGAPPEPLQQGTWRSVTPGEIFSPGRHYRMNIATGQPEVFEPAGGIMLEPEVTTGDNEPSDLTTDPNLSVSGDDGPPDVAPGQAPSPAVMFELTGLGKSGGILSKRISLMPDGSVKADGSACKMARGGAIRLHFDTAILQVFADTVANLESHEAIALGALRADLPDQVEIVTKRRLNELNRTAHPDVIARTIDAITYRPGQPALALLDIDVKKVPAEVRERVKAHGGYWAAVTSVLPDLKTCGRVVRRSTSAGVYRTDTGEKLPGSENRHVFVPMRDGTDMERFLKALHDRLWLAGLGWMEVSRSGQLLARSLIDRNVYSPQRLVFEGAPIVEPPLAQDLAVRAPSVTEGPPIDTRSACLDLTIVERAQLRTLKDAERHRLKGEVEVAQARVVTDHAERTGCTVAEARHAVERRLKGILLPDDVLLFDDEELGEKTVADVLADPDGFVGETLADPIEGIEYGPCKAKVMQGPNGSLWINSFAHGRTVYDLKHDKASIEAAVRAALDQDKVAVFIRLLLMADVSAIEEQQLRTLVCTLTGTTARPLSAMIKAAREAHKRQRAEAERLRRATERTDPRPQLPAPLANAEWLPVMDSLNEVLGASTEAEPPARDIEGYLTVVRDRRVPGLHALTASGANAEEPKENRLPPPEQPLLTVLHEAQAAELIEKYIEFDDCDTGQPVHLHSAFVQHFVRRHDNQLPLVAGVATLPLVLPDGSILSGRGLNRQYDMVLRVPEELEALLPRPEHCTETAVVAAMQLLTDNWFADVATDYTGRCTLISLALSIIERVLLDQRPAWMPSGGKRGVGKTTTINMISTGVLGRPAAAAAWSTSEEERRKALFSYLGEGVPLLVWDNIPLGLAISCPSIEKSLTSPTYQDRILGVSETRTVPATTIQVFTGNNITARGDMASRTLQPRLIADRPDPENRSYKHLDPIGWTQGNRGQILAALFTLLLGNPRLHDSDPPPAETRFKTWFHLVGSAVEHAARLHAIYADGGVVDHSPDCPPSEISFRSLLLGAEGEEEQSSSLATVLDVLRCKWPSGFMASDVAAFAALANPAAIEFMAALESASQKAIKVVTATTISWRLKALRDTPVPLAGGVYVLRYDAGHQGGWFVVRRL
jgi:hypothetical protein